MKSNQALNRFIARQRSEEKTAGLPLKDIRVIDLATVMAAPFAATLFGDLGAEVIKVENPCAADAIRGWGVIEEADVHPFWSVVGRNKFPVTINLKSGDGRRIFLDLVKKSDVLIENMRPGTMEKLGFGSQMLLAHNPGLIIGKVSGYGQTGPYAAKPGFGTLAEGFSGFTYLNAQPGGIPTNAPMALADFIAGLHLAYAIMVALRDQQRNTQGGQVIDISLYEPLFGLLGPDFLTYAVTGEVPQPKGNELSYVAPRNNYRTRDGKWVALSGAAQKPFERLMAGIGRPEMNTDPRFRTNEERIKEENRRIINQVIAEWIGRRNLDEVIDFCSRLGITVGPVASMQDIAQSPHYQARESFVEIRDPETGRNLKMPNVPCRMLGTPGRIRFPGLSQGAANEVIYGDLLGYKPAELERFRQNGAI